MRVWELLWKPRRREVPSQTKGELDLCVDRGKLSSALGYSIRNLDLFREALVHRSFLQVADDGTVVSNERLEFLGDAILNHIVSKYLFEENSTYKEGDLTKLRSRLVNRKALAAFAREVNLWDFLFLSHGAARSIDKGTDSMLADAYEAVIAAIYLDGGYKSAEDFVRRHIRHAIEHGIVKLHDENFKSQLLEHAQARALAAPRYTISAEEGPDHDRTYTVEVLLVGERLGSGTGKNKKDAEQAAAREALINLKAKSHP